MLNLPAFYRGLAETGYVEGHNVGIEYRWTGDRNDRLADLTVELIRRPAAVIVLPGSTANALAAKACDSNCLQGKASVEGLNHR